MAGQTFTLPDNKGRKHVFEGVTNPQDLSEREREKLVTVGRGGLFTPAIEVHPLKVLIRNAIRWSKEALG